MTAEVGLPMAAVIILLAGWLLARAASRIWRQQDMTLRWIGWAHWQPSGWADPWMFDFNLLAMPNAMLFSTLLAIVFLCGRPRPSPEDESKSGRQAVVELRRWQPRRLTFLVGRTGGVGVDSLACPTHWRPGSIRNCIMKSSQKTLVGSQAGRIISAGSLWLTRRWPAILATRYFAPAGIVRPTGLSSFPGESMEYMAAAKADSAAACQRLPADGDTLRIYASIYEQFALLMGGWTNDR